MTIGIDIGGTKSAVSLLEGNGQVREIHRFATKGPDETLEELAQAVTRADPGAAPLIGISVGTLGAEPRPHHRRAEPARMERRARPPIISAVASGGPPT